MLDPLVRALALEGSFSGGALVETTRMRARGKPWWKLRSYRGHIRIPYKNLGGHIEVI